MGDEEEARERRPGRVRNEPDEIEADRKHRAELDEAWAKRRAKETEELTAQEAANYERHHATDEKAGIGPGINEE